MRVSARDDLAVITEVVRQALNTPPPATLRPLSRDTLASEVPGWDSHVTVEVIFGLEAHYGFQMTSADMEAVKGVADLLSVIARQASQVARLDA